MLLAATILFGLLLLVTVSTVTSAFGIDAFVVHAGVIVAVHASLNRRFHEAAITMLFVAYLADMMASGPPGIHGLVLTLVFFALWGAARRVGGRLLLATAGLAFGASIVLDLAEALLVGLFYRGAPAMSIFLRTSIPNALATALLAVPYALLAAVLERLWAQRTQRSVMVD